MGGGPSSSNWRLREMVSLVVGKPLAKKAIKVRLNTREGPPIFSLEKADKKETIIVLQPEKLVSDVLFLEVLVISCIISKKNVTFVMRSLLK